MKAFVQRIIMLFLLIAATVFSSLHSEEVEKRLSCIEYAKFAEIARQADLIVIKESIYDAKDEKLLPKETKVIDSDKISEFIEAAEFIVPDGIYECFCSGEPALFLYKGEKLLARVSNHHGVSISSPSWDTNVEIKNKDKWLAWFDALGIEGPRKEHEESIREMERFIEYENQLAIKDSRWRAAMPESIKAVWDGELLCKFAPFNYFGKMDNETLENINKKLSEEIPSAKDRVLALFAWFGSGSGEWTDSEYPEYEDVPKHLLKTMDPKELTEILASTDLSEAQSEGAARFFSYHGNYLDKDHPKYDEVRDKLLKSSMKSDIPKNAERGIRAYGN